MIYFRMGHSVFEGQIKVSFSVLLGDNILTSVISLPRSFTLVQHKSWRESAPRGPPTNNKIVGRQLYPSVNENR